MTFDLGYITRQKRQPPLPSVNGVGGNEYQRTINGVNYKIHEFTSTNVIVFQIVPGEVECFTLGGGGGGGFTITGGGAASFRAGGGGAGGIITGTNIPVLPNVPYVVTVGGGGATGSPGGNGTDSSVAPANYRGYSVYFDGAGDYLSINSNANLQLGTSTFTVECWVRPLSAKNATIYDHRNSSGSTQTLFINITTSSSIYAGINLGNAGEISINTAPGTLALNTWSHVVLMRTSDALLRVFINGNWYGSVGTLNNFTNLTPSGGATIGGNFLNSAQSFDGYISNLRVVRGTAVYNTNTLVPPTSPLPIISGTQLITANSQSFTDFSSNNYFVVTNGNVQTTYLTPFREFAIGAKGGGGGGDANNMAGRSGASGGGAGANSSNTPASGGSPILVPVRQGFSGGAGGWQSNTAGGGGGGFTSAGSSGASGIPGIGGAGITLDYNGTPINYAGGGGATNGSNGVGGGSLANRGGGGGSQANGGSGIVYIRYPYTPPGA